MENDTQAGVGEEEAQGPSHAAHFDLTGRKSGYKNAQELLTDEIYIRASRANPRLREQLLGSILIRLKNNEQRYIFDWRTEQLKNGVTESTEADCVINLSEESLLDISHGDLNPQIGMLSDKIHITGKLSLAIYFFNLIAPRAAI